MFVKQFIFIWLVFTSTFVLAQPIKIQLKGPANEFKSYRLTNTEIMQIASRSFESPIIQFVDNNNNVIQELELKPVTANGAIMKGASIQMSEIIPAGFLKCQNQLLCSEKPGDSGYLYDRKTMKMNEDEMDEEALGEDEYTHFESLANPTILVYTVPYTKDDAQEAGVMEAGFILAAKH